MDGMSPAAAICCVCWACGGSSKAGGVGHPASIQPFAKRMHDTPEHQHASNRSKVTAAWPSSKLHAYSEAPQASR
jgi:hypothetical protein